MVFHDILQFYIFSGTKTKQMRITQLLLASSLLIITSCNDKDKEKSTTTTTDSTDLTAVKVTEKSATYDTAYSGVADSDTAKHREIVAQAVEFEEVEHDTAIEWIQNYMPNNHAKAVKVIKIAYKDLNKLHMLNPKRIGFCMAFNGMKNTVLIQVKDRYNVYQYFDLSKQRGTVSHLPDEEVSAYCPEPTPCNPE